MEKIKYIAAYKKGAKEKRVAGYIRVPKDLPRHFSADQLVKFVKEKHNITESETEITLKNYASKRFKYENATSDRRGIAQEAG